MTWKLGDLCHPPIFDILPGPANPGHHRNEQPGKSAEICTRFSTRSLSRAARSVSLAAQRQEFMSNYGRALYYPYIEIRDDRWIKLAALYYDGLSRIVPHGVQPEDSETVRALNEKSDFLRNLNPESDADPVANEFLNFALKFLEDSDFRFRFERELPELAREKADIKIHARKLSDILKIELPRLGLAFHSEIDWEGHVEYYRFRPVTGAMYMTCLANRMASDRELPLVSDQPVYQRIIRGVQDDIGKYESDPDQGYLLASAVLFSVRL
jgi:hypothetical protein